MKFSDLLNYLSESDDTSENDLLYKTFSVNDDTDSTIKYRDHLHTRPYTQIFTRKDSSILNNTKGGPTFIQYSPDGKRHKHVIYHRDDKKHRLDGPAEIYYHDDGGVFWSKYYINGKQYSLEDYEKIMDNVDNDNVDSMTDVSSLF